MVAPVSTEDAESAPGYSLTWLNVSGAAVPHHLLSDDGKPYTILKAHDKSYKNHVWFAINRASSEEW